MKTSYTNEFAFKNIVLLTDRDLLKLLRHIENEILLLACHGDAILIKRIGSTLSEHGRNCFHEDLGAIGIVHDADQAAAKKEVEDIFNELHQAGKLRDWATKYAS